MIRCHRCKSGIVRLAPQRGLAERLAGLLTIYPHRCQLCAHRFLRFCGHLASLPRRNFHRVRVAFPTMCRSAFYRRDTAPQQTLLVDLSIGGCRLDGRVEAGEGSRLHVEFATAPDDVPIVIDEAVVCSHPGRGVGLLFTKVRRDQRRRIARIIRHRLRPLTLDDPTAMPPTR